MNQDLLGHRRFGHGSEAVVVLHEWLGDHANWQPVLPHLCEDRFTWVLADLRGYGWSRGLSGCHTVAEAAADVVRLADHHRLARFQLVGHSMSAMIAQYLASTVGERITGVVAVSPVPPSGFRVDEASRTAMLAILDDDEAALAAIRARTGGRRSEAWLARKLAILRAAGTRDAMAGSLAMFTGTDFTERVRGLATPITAICGAHDLPVYRPEAVRATLAPLYPHLQVVEAADAGHYAMLEAPEWLAAAMQRALRA